MSKKDNPVPSIDLEHYRKFLIKRGFVDNGPIIYAHFNPLKAYLKKYGVETNNEKPKSGHMTEISWGSKKHPDEYEGLNGDNTSYFRK